MPVRRDAASLLAESVSARLAGAAALSAALWLLVAWALG